MSSALTGGAPRRALAGVAAIAMTGVMLVPGVAGASPTAPPEASPESKFMEADLDDDVVEGKFHVSFDGKSASNGGSTANMSAERDAFMADMEAAGLDVEVTSTHETLWNGVTVQVAEGGNSGDLATSDVVAQVFPVMVVEKPEPQEGDRKASGGPTPQMKSALPMSGVDQLHADGITGEGVTIGVIDDGVDIDHPDLGGSGEEGATEFPTDKVIGGWDFTGDNFHPAAEDQANQVPRPDANPDESCGGHGTHVSGIAAADAASDSGVTGVAPDAKLQVYRVFSCSGATSTEIILSAMEKAYDDGNDVVNMSLGRPNGWSQFPTSVMADALTAEGVSLTLSAGNDGEDGPLSNGSPSAARDAIAVASVQNTMSTYPTFRDAAGTQIPYVHAYGPVDGLPLSGTGKAVATDAPGSGNADGCEPYSDPSIEGNYLLVEFPQNSCDPAQSLVHADEAGAQGVIMYSEGLYPVFPEQSDLEFGFAYQSDLQPTIDEALASGSSEITFTDETLGAEVEDAGKLSYFSSFGANYDMWIKPDVAAPGGRIWSTIPMELGTYGDKSGTSMSAPYTAGAVALMLQANPELTPGEIRDRLANSGSTIEFNPSVADKTAPEGAELVHRAGAGLIHVPEAIDAEVVASPHLVQFGEVANGGNADGSVTLTNSSDQDKTFTVEHVASAATTGVGSDWDYSSQQATVNAPAEVTVPAGGETTLDFSIIAPGAAETMFGGYVKLTSGQDTTSIAYGGYAGDMSTAEIMTEGTPTGLAFEIATGDLYEYQPGTEFDFQSFAPAMVRLSDYGLPVETVKVFSADDSGAKGEELGTVYSEHFAPDGLGGEVWDGFHDAETGTGEVFADNGAYLLEYTFQKPQAFNDEGEPETVTVDSDYFRVNVDGEVATSPNVERNAGYDRYSTAAEIALSHWVANDETPETVYLASGENFPDALSGGAVAGSQEVPVLLTKEDALPKPTRAALQSLAPQNIVILGGTAAVSAEVETAAKGYAEVTRLSGETRYETAALASGEFDSADTVFVASGLKFPDALAASAVAGRDDAPVLLTDPDELSQATAEEIERLGASEIVVLGGDAAVSDEVAKELADVGEVRRIGGVDRYETARLINTEYFAAPADHGFLATGQEYADALATAPAAAKTQTPVFITTADELHVETRAAIEALEVANVTIVGGFNAVSDDVRIELESLVYGG